MILYLLTTPDYRAVVGYAECSERDPLDFSGTHQPRVTGYDTSQRQVFTRKGLTNAERRAHELGMRLVTAAYFGIGDGRPETTSAPAHARAQATRYGWPMPEGGAA